MILMMPPLQSCKRDGILGPNPKI